VVALSITLEEVDLIVNMPSMPSSFNLSNFFISLSKINGNESGLGEPGFNFTPEGWRLPLGVEWNGGIMEYWL
jgi:hypothetical protein